MRIEKRVTLHRLEASSWKVYARRSERTLSNNGRKGEMKDVATSATSERLEQRAKVEAKGKFLYIGGEKFRIRGATYGPFGPDGSGEEYHSSASVVCDFAQMVRWGFNAVRTYS